LIRNICKYILIFCALLPGAAMASHYDFDTTDVNMSILVRDIFLVSLHWSADDEIGLFTPDGVCGGGAVVDRFPAGLPAWGDDALTEEIDGFRAGEPIRFAYWDVSAETEINLEGVFVLQGEEVWQPNGLMIVDLREGGAEWSVRATGGRHRFTCSGIEVFWLEEAMAPADLDQIAIVAPDDRPVGVLIWNAEAGEASGWAYADDPATEDTVDGYQAGEALAFYLRYRRDDSTYYFRPDAEHQPLEWEITQGDTAYRTGGETRFLLSNDPYNAVRGPANPVAYDFLRIHPNPTNGAVPLELGIAQSGDYRLVLTDPAGRRIRTVASRRFEAGRSALALDLGVLPAGSYFLQLEGRGIRRTTPLHLLR